MTIWLVFHDHIEDSEFISAHLTKAGAEAVVFSWEDTWLNGCLSLQGGKRVQEVETEA